MELCKNKRLVNDYMNIPHNHSPQKLPKHVSKYKVMSTLQKAREKIKEIQKEVQKKQNEEKIKKEIKEQLETHINELKAQHFEPIIQSKKNEAKQKKKHKHPMAQMFDDSMKKQNQLLDEIEANHKQFSVEVRSTERELELMENSKDYVNNPGLAIGYLLQKWGEEPIETKAQFRTFTNELWKARSQFEQEIRKEEKGYEIRNRYMEDVYLTRTRAIRNQAGFLIEALETALTETKIKAQLEKDRCNMRIAEIESTFFNASKTDDDLSKDLVQANQLLSRHINFNDRQTQEQFMNTLKNLTQSVMSLNADKSGDQQTIKNLQFEIGQLQEKITVKDLNLISVYNQLNLNQKELYDQLQFTPFATPEYPLFSEVVKQNYENLSEAIGKFDYGKFKMTTITSQQKLDYLTQETDKVQQLLKNLGVKELMAKNKLFMRDKTGMMVEAMNEFQKIGVFEIAKQDTTLGHASISQKKSTLQADPNQLLEKMGLNVEITPEVARIMVAMQKSIHKQVKTKRSVLLAEEYLRQELEDKQYFDAMRMNLGNSESVEDEDKSQQQVNVNSAGTSKKGKKTKPGITAVKSLASDETPQAESVEEEDQPALKVKINSDSFRKGKNKQREESVEDLDQSAQQVKVNSGALKKLKLTKPEITEVKNSAAERAPQISVTVEDSGKQIGYKKKKVIQLNQPSQVASRNQFDDTETLHNKETFTPVNQEKDVAKNKSKKSTKDDFDGAFLAKMTKQSERNESQMSENPSLKSPRNKREAKSEFTRAANNQSEEKIGAEDKINEMYKDLIEETTYMDEQLLKFNTSQFEQLHRVFQVSLDKTLKSDDYMKMFETMHFDDLFGFINALMPKYIKQQNQENFCRLADCIVADIDPETGGIQGFSLRVHILKVLFYQDSCGIEEIKKVIKRVNYLNRILKSDKEEFGLIRPKPKETKTADSQANIELPEVVKKIEVTPDIEHLLDEMKSHLIGVAARGQIKRQQYYDLMWGDLQLDELLQVRIPNMQSQEDSDSQSIIGIQAKEYLSSIFKLMNERITENAEEERRSQSLDAEQRENSQAESEILQAKSQRNSIKSVKIKQKSSVKRSKQFLVKELDVNSEIEQSFHTNFSASHLPNSQLHVNEQQLPSVLTPKSLIGNTGFKPNGGDTKSNKVKQTNEKPVLQDKQTQTEASNQVKQTQTLEASRPLNARVPPISTVLKVQTYVQTDPMTIESPEKRSPFVGIVEQQLRNEINRTIDNMSVFVQNLKEAKEIEAQIRSGSSLNFHNKVNLKGDSPERTLQNVNDVIAKDSDELKQRTINIINKAKEHRETQKTFSNRKTTIDSQHTNSTLPILINGKSGELRNSKEKLRLTDSNFIIRPNFQRLDKRMLQTQLGGLTKSQFNIDSFRNKYKSPEPSKPIMSGTGDLSAFALDFNNPARMQIQLNGFLNETSERNLNKMGANYSSEKQSKSDFKNQNSGKNSGALMKVSFRGFEAPMTVTPILITQSVKQIAMQLNNEANSVTNILRKRNQKLEHLLNQ